MGAAFLWHTWGDPTSYMLGILDEEKHEIWKANIQFNYHYRCVDAEQDRYGFANRWWSPVYMAGDPVSGITYMTGQEVFDKPWTFENWHVHAGGSSRPGVLTGQCTDG